MDEVQYQYRVMFDNMAQGAFYQSRDGSLIDVNKAALAMFGLTREEFLLPAIDPEWRCVRDDGSELPQEQYPSVIALRTGQPVRDCVAGIFNLRRQIMIWLNINAIPMFREGESHPYQVFVTLHDVSEEKRMNDIHLSRIRLMQFAHLHPLDELMVEALDELERLTGSVIGFYHLYDDHDRCVTLKAWSTRTATLFCQVKDKGGHYSIDQAGVWVDCIPSGGPVIHNDYATLPHRRGLPEGHAPVLRELVVPVQRNGRIVAILGIGNKPAEYTAADVHTASLFADLTWDIAERKQAEMLLLQANETLEQRVSQRTADLQAAIREQEAFSYSVSHDLRAPLRHINSFSAVLKEEFGDSLPDEATRYLDRIRSASTRMGTLIDHLLELSRVTRMEIVPVTVDLSELATAALRMLAETEPHRQVELCIEPGLAARGDMHLLSQLLGNLLGNAWKYTSRKPVARIGFGKTVLAGQEAFFVSDNGAGFDMTYQEKLFKPFERLHGSEFEGVGIGLATAQRIVTRHGGRIWGGGSLDEGATFYFTLPAVPPTIAG